MARRGGLKSWLFISGALVVGSMFATQIKEFLSKIPVIGDMINNASPNA